MNDDSSQALDHNNYPVKSIIGNLGEMMLKKDNPVATARMFNHLVWQLNNLGKLQNSYAEKVRMRLE